MSPEAGDRMLNPGSLVVVMDSVCTLDGVFALFVEMASMTCVPGVVGYVIDAVQEAKLPPPTGLAATEPGALGDASIAMLTDVIDPPEVVPRTVPMEPTTAGLSAPTMLTVGLRTLP